MDAAEPRCVLPLPTIFRTRASLPARELRGAGNVDMPAHRDLWPPAADTPAAARPGELHFLAPRRSFCGAAEGLRAVAQGSPLERVRTGSANAVGDEAPKAFSALRRISHALPTPPRFSGASNAPGNSPSFRARQLMVGEAGFELPVTSEVAAALNMRGLGGSTGQASRSSSGRRESLYLDQEVRPLRIHLALVLNFIAFASHSDCAARRRCEPQPQFFHLGCTCAGGYWAGGAGACP